MSTTDNSGSHRIPRDKPQRVVFDVMAPRPRPDYGGLSRDVVKQIKRNKKSK